MTVLTDILKPTTLKIVVMGVSGCGKSAIAAELAKRLGVEYVDGDHYHAESSIEKMSRGIPLADEDRLAWLQTLNGVIQKKDGLVLACSALTPMYRSLLKEGNQQVIFIYLHGPIELIWSRMRERVNHYFAGRKLLESQFDTLIEPNADEAIAISIDQPIERIVESALAALSDSASTIRGETL